MLGIVAGDDFLKDLSSAGGSHKGYNKFLFLQYSFNSEGLIFINLPS